MPEKDMSWQPPEFIEKGMRRAGWCADIISEGEKWLQAQPAYKDIQRGFDIIAGLPGADSRESRSPLNSNRAKRSIREIVAALSDTRTVDCYSTDNKALADEATMLNRVAKALAQQNNFTGSLKRVVQWFAVTGTGFMYPQFRKKRMGPGSPQSIYFDNYGALDILPFMIPMDGDWQGCYAQTIVEQIPVPWAHQKFPQFQHKLQPMSKKRYATGVGEKRIPLWQRFSGRNASALGWEKNYCEVRKTLIRDMRINTSGILIPMGTPGGSESYVVPSVGMQIPSHETQGGVRVTREAKAEDCYFYPHMRLMITADGVDDMLYDGPNFDWSNMFPARYSADDWAWERMGYSLIRDIYEIERSRQNVERGIDQITRHRADPSMAYDKQKVATKTAEGFDPWKERGRLGVDGEVDEKTFRTLMPESMLNVPAWMFEAMKHLETEEDYMLGLNAISSMAKAKLGLDGDAMEKLLELSGPLVKDVSHSMEPPTQDVMETVKFLIFQYMDTPTLMRYVGPDGVTPVTLDFDPMKLYPSHMPTEEGSGPSQFSRIERAKNFAQNFPTIIDPNSLHSVQQTAQKLLMMQLWRAGFPIAPDTVAKALDVPNWGILDGNTEFEKWQNYKKKEIEFAAQVKELAGSLMPQGQPPAGPGAGGGPKGSGGRPPSGKKPPAAKTKGSAEGPRATITES